MQSGSHSDSAGSTHSRAAASGNSPPGPPTDDEARQAAFAEWLQSAVIDVGSGPAAEHRGAANERGLVAERRGAADERGLVAERGTAADGLKDNGVAANRLMASPSAARPVSGILEEADGIDGGFNAGDAPQVRHVQFQYRYEFRPRTWLGRTLGAAFALAAGTAMLALFAFSFAFFFLPLFALAFLFFLFLLVFQRRGEDKGSADRSGHGRVRTADTPPDDLVEQQVVRRVLFRKIERR